MHDAGDRNHRILFNVRPVGLPAPDNFRADTTAVPTPGPGQFLSRTLYLSLDPYYRASMQGTTEPSRRLDPGDVMMGETVAQVLESRHQEYRSGEYVVVRNGWQQFALSSGQGVRRLDPGRAPVSTALGVLGLPGLAGYTGLIYMGEPRPGQTVLVSSATGAVGCTAGQTARLVGARAVGMAGSDEKCDYAVRELGFSACINYRAGDLAAQIRSACPDGVDVYFDNVGGEVLAGVLGCLAPHARVILCGMSEAYNLEVPPPGPFLGPVLSSRASLRGIMVQDHLQRLPELERVVGGWIRSGVFRYKEDVSEGLASAPEAFCRLMRGANFGKALVRVAPEHL
ncbi:MAG TPA: NADP-dependent oxidoreductase [Steroidobacteraceae bacterium]|nr:NADP-dependent oxidoreductase [Steroidobacteraceae bacterium]